MNRRPLTSRPKTNGSFLHEHRQQILITISLLYLIGGIIFGCILVGNVQAILQAYTAAQRPGRGEEGISDPAILAGTDEKTKDDLAVAKENRVNILLLGIDQRDEERRRGDPTRTDTIILATIDLTNKTAGILSVPRDLYVTIPDIRIPGNAPGPQIDRINTAHFWGDWLKYPGGGTELVKKTFTYNFGVPVDYYARIDFRGFEKAVDALGGVTINVERAIYDAEYPTDDYETMEIYFAAGKQTLNGTRALQYARTRHTDNDFGRSKRQQQILVAIAQQSLKVDAIPKLPSLLSILGSSFKTDIPVAEMLKLGNAFKDIDTNDLITRQIDATMTTATITSGGASVLIPKKDKIDLAFQDIFYGQLIRREGARIAVLSGVNKANVADRLAKNLQQRGYEVTKIDDADNKDYAQSQLIYHTVKPYTANTLIKHLKTYAPALSIVRDTHDEVEADLKPAPRSDSIDITIVVGQDLAESDFD